MKKSYYAIASDPLNIEEDRVLYSTRTNETLVVSKDIFETFDRQDFQFLSEDTIEKLTRLKLLVPNQEDELRSIIEENAEAIKNDSVMYEVIQPTANCQLGCDYCGQSHEKKNIELDFADLIIQRFEKKMQARKYKVLYIGWFGGEPLLALKQIRELTPLLRQLCEKYNLNYAAKVVTNGLSLKPKIYRELVTELGVDKIEVTLDGTKEFHDQRRHTKTKLPTFDIIFQNLLDVFADPSYNRYHGGISIRCNVDTRNFESIFSLIDLIDQHKIQFKISYFYTIGVYSWGNDAHEKSLTKEEFATREIDWLIDMIERDFPLIFLPNRVKKVCLAVSPTSEVIDTYGNIFNCTEVSYVPAYNGSNYLLGNLRTHSGDLDLNRSLADWNESLIDDTFPCHSCKMLPVCGGGCPKSWHEGMRACPPNKFNIKDKLSLVYLISENAFEKKPVEPMVIG